MYEQKGTVFSCKQRALQAHIAASCILSFICISKNKATSSPGGCAHRAGASETKLYLVSCSNLPFYLQGPGTDPNT